jgi:guanylate kinase
VINNNAKLFVFSAPSGTGKTTIIQNVLSNNPEFVFSISVTTRKQRTGEIAGVHYYFVDEAQFIKNIEEEKFIEWEKFYDYYYGTLKETIDTNLKAGKTIVFEVDVKGALKIKKQYPSAVLIFIAPPSLEILKERLVKRNTETEEDLRKRIERSELEMSFKDKFDYVVTNLELEIAKEEVKKIIENETMEVQNGN